MQARIRNQTIADRTAAQLAHLCTHGSANPGLYVVARLLSLSTPESRRHAAMGAEHKTHPEHGAAVSNARLQMLKDSPLDSTAGVSEGCRAIVAIRVNSILEHEIVRLSGRAAAHGSGRVHN